MLFMHILIQQSLLGLTNSFFYLSHLTYFIDAVIHLTSKPKFGKDVHVDH